MSREQLSLATGSGEGPCNKTETLITGNPGTKFSSMMPAERDLGTKLLSGKSFLGVSEGDKTQEFGLFQKNHIPLHFSVFVVIETIVHWKFRGRYEKARDTTHNQCASSLPAFSSLISVVDTGISPKMGFPKASSRARMPWVPRSQHS